MFQTGDIIGPRTQADYQHMVADALCAQRRGIAERLYSPSELMQLPSPAIEVALGLGNPVAAADIQIGETVLDLGSGGGIDSLLAARRVGVMGRVIGIDITPGMVQLAQHNAEVAGLSNVEFVLGSIEDLGFVPDGSVDVIVSNGVINLVSDKHVTFAEIYRVLKPGKRAVLSDMIVNGEIPPEVLVNPAAWSG